VNCKFTPIHHGYKTGSLIYRLSHGSHSKCLVTSAPSCISLTAVPSLDNIRHTVSIYRRSYYSDAGSWSLETVNRTRCVHGRWNASSMYSTTRVVSHCTALSIMRDAVLQCVSSCLTCHSSSIHVRLSVSYTLLRRHMSKCVRLSRLLVGFQMHFKSLHFHSFIHSFIHISGLTLYWPFSPH